MLAEIFMVRLEAAARLQQEPASLSSSSFVPFTANNHFLFKDVPAFFCVLHQTTILAENGLEVPAASGFLRYIG